MPNKIIKVDKIVELYSITKNMCVQLIVSLCATISSTWFLIFTVFFFFLFYFIPLYRQLQQNNIRVLYNNNNNKKGIKVITE